MNTNTPRALGYVRTATTPAKGHNSIAEQRARLTAYCEAHGIELVGIEVDDGVHGLGFDRPGLGRALSRMTDVDTLLVTSTDRLARDQAVVRRVLRQLAEVNAAARILAVEVTL